MKINNLEANKAVLTKTISATICEDTHETLSKVALKTKSDISKIVRSLIQEFLDENKEFVDSIEDCEENVLEVNAQLSSDESLPQGSAV